MANLILWTSMHREYATVRTVAAYQLASWLRKHGYTVKVIDFCHMMTTEELVTITEKYIGPETIAIGVSSTFWQDFEAVLNRFLEPTWVLNARKEIESRHKLYWLLGGGAATRGRKNNTWITFPGYAEDSLLQWMDNNSSKFRKRDLFDIQTSKNGFVEDDFIRPFEVLPMELGRGCQFKCSFCSFPLIGKKKGTYIRDLELIKAELLENYEKWGLTRYYFVDDTVNESEEKVYAMAELAQSLPFRLEWVGYNRLDLIWSRPGTVKALKDSGLRSAFFGVESFHPEAARAVGKGWMGKKSKDFILELKKEWNDEITWKIALIVGLPGENEESIIETHNWCRDNEMYEWNFGPLYITRDPGKVWKSQFETEYEKFGYTFANPTTDHWKNEHFTFARAVELSKRLSSEAKANYTMPTAFDLGQNVGLGYSFDEMLLVKRKDLPLIEFIVRQNAIAREYIDYQINISI